jgi:hypothetical protein
VNVTFNGGASVAAGRAFREPSRHPRYYSWSGKRPTTAFHRTLKSCRILDFLGGRSLGGAAEVAVAPDGRLLFVSTRLDAAQPDGTFAPLEGYLTVFRLNRDAGGLTPVAAVRVGKEPRHFSVDPDRRFLIVANQFSDSVVSYRIDRDWGNLTQVDTAAVSHPDFAGAVRLDRCGGHLHASYPTPPRALQTCSGPSPVPDGPSASIIADDTAQGKSSATK